MSINDQVIQLLSLSLFVKLNFEIFKQVFVGRPALWGLTVGGQAGVQRMLNIFRTELEYTFQIAGMSSYLFWAILRLKFFYSKFIYISVHLLKVNYVHPGTPTIADITRDMVRHESTYSKL